jgi:hypothetical protein
MLQGGILAEPPDWYYAARMFRPPVPTPSVHKEPPKLHYLEDDLLEQFHRRYYRKYREAYVGVSHLTDPKDPRRPKKSYRNTLVARQAELMRGSGMNADQAFEAAAKELEDLRRKERNKLAIMSRWALDSKSKHLDQDVTELQSISEVGNISRALQTLRKRVG